MGMDKLLSTPECNTIRTEHSIFYIPEDGYIRQLRLATYSCGLHTRDLFCVVDSSLDNNGTIVALSLLLPFFQPVSEVEGISIC
jgi:hypothetical protein